MFEKIKPLYLFIILGIVSFGIYANSLQNEFVFDDESVVVNNTSIQSLSNIPKYFTADEGFHKVIGRYYRPVVSTTYAIDYAIWGLKPFGFHLTNILIHLISSLLLFALLKFMFKNYKFGLTGAFIGSLLFAVHPIHTEAVAWVSGRTDSLVTLFFFASFLFYIKYSDDLKSQKNLNWALAFYALGLLSKEMIITMPVFILLYDFIFKKESKDFFKKNIRAYLLFAGVTVLYLIIRYLVLKDIPEREKYLYFYGIDGITALGTMLKTIPVYLKLLFVPFNLLYHYNGVISDAKSLFDAVVLLSALFVIAGIAVPVLIRKDFPVFAFAILFFFISLLPVMNIIPTMNLMAERFLYLSSFALSVAVAGIVIYLKSENGARNYSLVVIIILLIFSFLTFQRNKDWVSEEILFATGEGVDGTVLLVNSGNQYANSQKYDIAKEKYLRAIGIRDNNVLAHHNLGQIYILQNVLDSAEIHISRGIAIDSLAPDGYFQLSNLYQMMGRNEDAIPLLEKLQQIIPDYRGSLAVLNSLKSGETNELGLIPNSPAGNDLAVLQKRSYQLFQSGKFELAIKDLEKLVEIDPLSASGYLNNMAMCYIELKDFKKAEDKLNESIGLDAGNVNALSGLADVYLKTGRKKEAIEAYRKILAVNPKDENAMFKLDSLNK